MAHEFLKGATLGNPDLNKDGYIKSLPRRWVLINVKNIQIFYGCNIINYIS